MSKRKPRPVTMPRVPAYGWDDELGVVIRSDFNPLGRQAIQLLHGPSSLEFRRHCGLLLVDALNAEASKAERKGTKR